MKNDQSENKVVITDSTGSTLLDDGCPVNFEITRRGKVLGNFTVLKSSASWTSAKDGKKFSVSWRRLALLIKQNGKSGKTD